MESIVKQQARLELQDDFDEIYERCVKTANHLTQSYFYYQGMIQGAEGGVPGMLDHMLAMVIEHEGDVDTALDEYLRYCGREYSRSYRRIQALNDKINDEREGIRWSTLGQWVFDTPARFVDTFKERSDASDPTEESWIEAKNTPLNSLPAGEAEAFLEASLLLQASKSGTLATILNDEWRRCVRCDKAAPADQFKLHYGTKPPKPGNVCKECDRADKRKWWRRHRMKGIPKIPGP